MKKLLPMFLAAAMLVGCSSTPASSGTGSGSAKPEGGKTITVGVPIYQFNDNFMTVYRGEIQKFFEEQSAKDGNKYDVRIVDGNNDMATQTEQVNTFISQGVDVMLVNLVQTSSGETIAKACQDANIPVVFINREMDGYEYPENQCYVGADARQSGTYQGEIIRDLADKGDLNGDGKVSYIMIMGDPENSDAQYRTEFSIKALTDAGIEVDCLFQQTGNWNQDQGQELVANALNKEGDKVEVVFCNNDGMALGALQAINAAGRKVGEDIYLVGVDALDEAVANVIEGTFTGTVLNDAHGQAYKACEVAVGYLNGEKPAESVIYVDYVKVTKDNAADYAK